VLGAILLEQGDKHGAAVHLFQESTYFPIDASLLAQTSALTFELQQWSETDTVYQSLERMTPLSSKQRLHWAQATFNLEDYPLALERLQPALESAPNDADILLLHANILAKVGEREQGLEVFKRAKSLNKKRLNNASQSR
jgi:tetratricopeptide (TPR) repeat protein